MRESKGIYTTFMGVVLCTEPFKVKKILLVLFVLTILSLSVSAGDELTIKQFLDSSTNENTIAVMGDLTSDSDAYFVINRIVYAKKLDAYAQNDEGISNVIATKENIILIGGPCVNTRFWSTYSDETCDNWPYDTREYLVQAIHKGNQNILLIAGTHREDTFNIVEKISNTPNNAMFTQKKVDSIRVGEAYDSQCSRATETDNCKTLTLGYQIPYRADDGRKYAFELLAITDTQKDITFEVNGDEHVLERGESVTIDGIELTFDNLGFDYSTGKPTKAVLYSSKKLTTSFGAMETPNDEGSFDVSSGLYFLRFSLTGKVITFNLKEIGPDNSNAQMDINEKEYSLAKGDSITVDGVELTVKKIDFDIYRVFFDYEK